MSSVNHLWNFILELRLVTRKRLLKLDISFFLFSSEKKTKNDKLEEVAAAVHKDTDARTSLLIRACLTARLRSDLLSYQVTLVTVWSTDEPGAWDPSICQSKDPMLSAAGMVKKTHGIVTSGCIDDFNRHNVDFMHKVLSILSTLFLKGHPFHEM